MAFLFHILISFALAVGPSKSRKINQVEPLELGQCRPKSDPSKNLTEEDLARAEAKYIFLKNDEILARLIFSEALSTGYWKKRCQADSPDALMKAIGWGIMNRVDKNIKLADPYYDVVFAKMQFRTSFSSKKENPFAMAFLCPSSSQNYLGDEKGQPRAADIYSLAQSIAIEIIKQYETAGIPVFYKGITNFFYPYSEFFGELRPSWAKNPIASKNKGFVNLSKVKNNLCIEAYKF